MKKRTYKTSANGRSAIRRLRRSLYAGLALTVIALLVPLVDMATVDSLTGHVQAAYPDWSADLVALDRNAIVVYLSVVGVLGIGGWLWTLRAVSKGGRRARVVVTGMFAVGTTIAATNLTFSGGAYDQIIPTLYGVIGFLPSLAGLIAVISIWQSGSSTGMGDAVGRSELAHQAR